MLAVLLVSACAVLTGARSFVAIAEYAHDPGYGRWTAKRARRLQQRGRAGAPGSVLGQDSGVVLAQVQVDAKSGELVAVARTARWARPARGPDYR